MRLIHKIILTTLFVTCTLINESYAQLVTYTFGSTTTPVVSANQVAGDLTASIFSGNLGSPSTGGSTPLSSGAYFTATTWTGSTPGTNYFEFTITPDSGFMFSTTSLSFDYRATSTGPSTLAIRSSADSYAAALGSFTTTADSTWYSSGVITTALSNLTVATTFRIYGFGASNAGGTLRVDNVTLSGSVSAVPEPATFAFLAGAATLSLAAFRRRHTSRLKSTSEPTVST
jgi:hypothetical protein